MKRNKVVRVETSVPFSCGDDHRIVVETNGPQGGDAGHGGYVSLEINFSSGFALNLDGDGEQAFLKLRAMGDAESEDLAGLLEAAASEIRGAINHSKTS